MATKCPRCGKDNVHMTNRGKYTAAIAAATAAAAAAGQGERGKTAPIKVDKSVGRNEPCPCGSGKKYKHCHGKL